MCQKGSSFLILVLGLSMLIGVIGVVYYFTSLKKDRGKYEIMESSLPYFLQGSSKPLPEVIQTPQPVVTTNFDQEIALTVPEGWKKGIAFSDYSGDSWIEVGSPDYETVDSYNWSGLLITVEKLSDDEFFKNVSLEERYKQISDGINDPNPAGAKNQNLKRVSISGYEGLSYDYMFEGNRNFYELWNEDDIWRIRIYSSNGNAQKKYEKEINSLLNTIKFL